MSDGLDDSLTNRFSSLPAAVVVKMSSDDEPTAPASIPAYLRDGMLRQDVETLRDIEDFADALADHRADDPVIDKEKQEDSEPRRDDQGDELPDDVPRRATLTKKTINDNEYWYYQWSADGKTKSEYKGPVNPDR